MIGSPRIGHLPAVAAANDRPPPAADISLVPGRAAVLDASRTLLVSDLHLGKAETFRRFGIPVPEGSARRDLDRLVELVTAHGIRRVLVLGDLFHADRGCTPDVCAEFAATRARIAATSVVLVLGNHDRGVGRLPDALGIDAVVPELDEPPFRFIHDPTAPRRSVETGRFTIAGHLHPTVSLSSPSGDRLSERCFVAERDALILPAFGSFTGGRRIEPAADTRIWIARDDGVAEVTHLLVKPSGR